jgi:hypothetical protein
VRGSVAEGPGKDWVLEVVADRATRREADCVFVLVVVAVASGVTDSSVAVTVTASWDPEIVLVSLSVHVTDGYWVALVVSEGALTSTLFDDDVVALGENDDATLGENDDATLGENDDATLGENDDAKLVDNDVSTLVEKDDVLASSGVDVGCRSAPFSTTDLVISLALLVIFLRIRETRFAYGELPSGSKFRKYRVTVAPQALRENLELHVYVAYDLPSRATPPIV